MWPKLTITISCLLIVFSANSSPVDVILREQNPTVQIPQLDGKIVGGDEVPITRFPWQLSILRYNFHTCGASIIDKKFALTAAHCVYGVEETALKLRAGSTNHNAGGILYPVTKYYVHPSFNKGTMDYDIAILKVKPNFAIGSTLIQTIHLPEIGYAPKDGSMVTVSGWGVLASSSAEISTHLRAVTVPVVSKFECKEAYGADLITNRMLCAGYTEGGKDACQGDSGGPLVQANTLVGIVSWGEGCAIANRPGVYSDVGNLRTWITYITGI